MGRSRKRKRRTINPIWLAVAASAVLGIGSTMAYLTDSQKADNRVTIGKLDIQTVETLTGLVKDDIGVVSLGDIPANVRMQANIPSFTYTYTENGQKKEAQAAIILPDGTELTASEWMQLDTISTTVMPGNTPAVWEYHDGYWYLSVPLNQSESAKLIQSVTYPGLWNVDTDSITLPADLTVDMLKIVVSSDGIQAGIGGTDNAYDAFRVFLQQQ